MQLRASNNVVAGTHPSWALGHSQERVIRVVGGKSPREKLHVACQIITFYSYIQLCSVPYPEFFWTYRYMYRDLDFNESIGERTA